MPDFVFFASAIFPSPFGNYCVCRQNPLRITDKIIGFIWKLFIFTHNAISDIIIKEKILSYVLFTNDEHLFYNVTNELVAWKDIRKRGAYSMIDKRELITLIETCTDEWMLEFVFRILQKSAQEIDTTD